MDKSLRDRVAVIAYGVRNYIQANADKTGYNPEDLNGWCAIASAELHRRLTAADIVSEIRMFEDDWGCHCYCVVEDYVVDVTATQFSEFVGQEVVIMHTKEAETFEYYTGEKIFQTAKDLRKYQKRNRWPSNQIAYA